MKILIQKDNVHLNQMWFVRMDHMGSSCVSLVYKWLCVYDFKF